jgi:tetratricopeptide (TPR) repeat protein
MLDPAGVLVQYSFDDDNIETGPDTFAVIEAAKGRVELTTAIRYSGYRAVEIREVEADRNFPELQGYFPLRRGGRLYAHFALLTVDPNEVLNIALAGPQWFTNRKDGIAFWLSTRNGYLYHHSDSIPKKLFPLTPFAWYLVDVAYDIDRGRYDLTVHQEGLPEPVVDLKDQVNAVNAPGSAVDKFSFIGDTGEDTSNAVYYVDDVVIGTDENIVRQPFAAPGRKKLFIDSWRAFQRKARGRPACLPARDAGDFGVDPKAYRKIVDEELVRYLGESALAGPNSPDPERVSAALRSADAWLAQRVRGVTEWNRGCVHLFNGRGTEALADFNAALAGVPDSTLYRLSVALARAVAGEVVQAETDLMALRMADDADLRIGVALAMVATLNRDWFKGESELLALLSNDNVGPGTSLPLNLGPVDGEFSAEFGSGFPLQWRTGMHRTVIEEQYLFLLLWQEKYDEAYRFATAAIERLPAQSPATALWQERAGDAAFLAGNRAGALQHYQASLTLDSARSSAILKLSDVYYLTGDLEREREYREKIYGTLRPR